MRSRLSHSSGWRAAVICALLPVLCAAASLASEMTPFAETIPGTLVKFEMLPVPAGEIRIPNPDIVGACRQVSVPAMWVGKTEVTWDEYDVFTLRLDEPEQPATPDGEKKDAITRPSKPYGTADAGFGRKGYPVINVSFVGARQYCKWLSAKTGRSYRLPTEAEWEHACRAAVEPPPLDQLASYAVFWEEKTSPVAKKLPNAWGLYDMLGNVAEWCTDLRGKPVACGGSWDDRGKDITPAARKYQDDSWRANDPQNPKSIWWLSDGPFVGFRVVCVENEGGENR